MILCAIFFFLLFTTPVTAWQFTDPVHPQLAESLDQQLKKWGNIADPQQQRQTVADAISNDATLQVALLNPSKEDSAEFKNDLIILANILLEELRDKQFSWCKCMNPGIRLLFVLELYQQIKKAYPKAQNNLSMTSIASGGLLQDYVIAAFLIHKGYTHIDYALIDAGYPIWQEIHKDSALRIPTTLKNLKRIDNKILHDQRFANHFLMAQNEGHLAQFLEKNSLTMPQSFFNFFKDPMPIATIRYKIGLLTSQGSALETIETFEARLASLALTHDSTASFIATYYESPERYRDKIVTLQTRGHGNLSNVLFLVDPGMGLGQSTNFSSEANEIVAYQNSQAAAVIFLDPQMIRIYYNSTPKTQFVRQTIKTVVHNALKSSNPIALIKEKLHHLASYAQSTMPQKKIRIVWMNDPILAFKTLGLKTTAPNAITSALIYSMHHQTYGIPTIYFWNHATLEAFDPITNYNGRFLAREWRLQEPKLFPLNSQASSSKSSYQ